MKIGCIVITLEPNEAEAEKNMAKVAISRNENKIWNSSREDGGLYPYEIKLAGLIQELIGKWNSGIDL